jgi:DNA-binding LacI/PurR family transcriptional regulator
MKTKTIAYLTRSLTDATGKNTWLGIAERCRQNNLPVITFWGSILNEGPGSILYHLFQPSLYGGVISWASSEMTPETISYYNKFGTTPLISISFQIPGHPVIVTDCKIGMIELVDHFVTIHHKKNIAFIRGPESHVYAKERYAGYLEALKKNNIPVNEQLITPPGGWGYDDGANAVASLLSKGLVPGKDFDAIIAAGDNIAIGAQEYITSQGYLIPKDIALGGFNGSPEAACCNPPITSVEMPFFGQGGKAFDLLKLLMDRQTVPDRFNYSTRLVIGESCGCTSRSVKRATYHQNEELFQKELQAHKTFKLLNKTHSGETKGTQTPGTDSEWKQQTATRILNLISQERFVTPAILSFFKSAVPSYIDSFCDALNKNDQSDTTYYSDLAKSLNTFITVSSEFSLWQDCVSILRINILPLITNTPYQTISENLFQQSRVIINEFDDHTQKQQNLFNAQRETTLRTIGSTLLTSYDITKLMDILANSMKKLKIPGVYVVLYNNCQYTEKNKRIPERSRVMLAMHDNNRIQLPPDGVEFNTTDILPDSLFPTTAFYSFVVQSLHFQDTFIGYLIFQQGPETAAIYSALRDQLSSSLYGALLLTERTNVKQVLEHTLHGMSSKADVVSSHSRQVTGNVTTISHSMKTVAASISRISDNIKTVMNTVKTANDNITEATSSITTLMESTKKIEQSVSMINDIAEKTNVLALNAAIEAAHAGDAGRGFSVVAKEVKNLAVQTVSSTKMIQELVHKNNQNTAETEKIIESTNTAIKTIAALSNQIQESITEQVQSSAAISSQLQDASSGTDEIAKAIDEIAKLGEQLI